MDLPARTLTCIPHCWPVHRGGLVPEDARWLIFAICRVLLGKDTLAAAFRQRDASHAPRLSQQAGCLLCPDGRGPRRRISATRSTERPGRPQDVDEAAARRADDFCRLPVPAWLLGGICAFRRDRWAFAPRGIPNSERKRAKKAADKYKQEFELQQQQQADAEDTCDPEQQQQFTLERLQELQRRQEHLTSSFVDVSRLFAHATAVADADSDDEGEGAGTEACHFGCTGCSRRARCINLWHLAWGSPADNSYHAVQHRQGKAAGRHRPAGYVSPSKRPGYDRHAKH